MRGFLTINRPLVPLAVCFLVALTLLDHLNVRFLHPPLTPELTSLLGREVVLEETLSEPIEVRPEGSRARFGKILLTLPFVPSWEVGDRIRFETRLKRPRRYQIEGGFDYRRSLERKGILLVGYLKSPEKGEVIQKGRPALTVFEPVRKKIPEIFEENVSPRAAGFLSALVVGTRKGITPEVWDDFRRTGTAHLIAISGQHIGMIGVAFYTLFHWFLRRSQRILLSFSVRKIAGLLTLGPVFFYTLLAGAPPSAMRAAIAAVFLFLAPVVGREVDLLSTLAVAAIGISLFDPAAPFSPSFQLSFLAILGIFLFDRGRISSETLWGKYLVRPFWMSLGATLMTGPLVASLFHQVSLSGLLTNLWAIPFVTLLLLLSCVSLIGYVLLKPLGTLLLSLDGILTDLFLKLVHLSSDFSWVVSFYPTAVETIACFVAVGLLAWFCRRPDLKKGLVLGFVLLTLVVAHRFFSSPFSRNLEVTFLDVGQGDATLLLTPTGESLLIDGGGFLIPGQQSRFDIGQEVLIPYLKRRGLERIDRILLSHPHPDHYGGLAAVVQAFPVGEFWHNGQTFPDETYEQLLKVMDERHVPQKILRKGDPFEWAGLQIEVLYPSEIDPARNINDNSLVVRISFGEAKILFPGDVEKKGERALADFKDIGATVVKIPHHGSKTSSSVPFIDFVHPQFAVASLGEGNFFGFPHPGILEKYERRDVKVYRTDRNGSVTFIVPPGFPEKKISIRPFSSGK